MPLTFCIFQIMETKVQFWRYSNFTIFSGNGNRIVLINMIFRMELVYTFLKTGRMERILLNETTYSQLFRGVDFLFKKIDTWCILSNTKIVVNPKESWKKNLQIKESTEKDWSRPVVGGMFKMVWMKGDSTFVIFFKRNIFDKVTLEISQPTGMNFQPIWG